MATKQAKSPSAMPPWISVLVATSGVQIAIAFAVLAIPITAPLLTAEAGIPPETVGYLTVPVYAGSVLYLLVGSPVIPRLGPVRTLQAGAAAAAVGLLLTTTGLLPVLVLGAFLVGIGNGPNVPAGSRILARSAPPEHRTLIFSVKQAGAPLGGLLAGLVLPPIALVAGWEAALLVAGALLLAAAMLAQPMRAGLDAERDVARRIGLGALLKPANLAAPFAALGSHSALRPLCGVIVALGVVQGAMQAFAVTVLTTAHGYEITTAGTVFAALQVGGFAGRIGLAWLADRTRAPIPVLLGMLGAASGSVLAFALLAGAAPLPVVAALAFVIGVTGLGWQGIVLAEFARLAPAEKMADATAGGTICAFLTFLAAPGLFAILVQLSGSWTLPLLLIAAQAALALVLLTPPLLREGRANPIRARE